MPKKHILHRICDTQNTHLPHLHPVLQRVYAARGVVDVKHLNYTLANLQAPILKGLTRAVELLCEARADQQRLLIVGDFDADGATSTALAMRCLTSLGFKHVNFLVPNRFEYGYGLTPEIVDVAEAMKPDCIITVDNGIASLDGVARAHELGIKVIVTDHHLPGRELPPADAIVNPNQPGCEFLSKSAAGVGVVFYLMMALRSRLRELHQFNEQIPEPNLAKYLDLVALGTVADVVPLDYNNRILVSQGLARIKAEQSCVGIRALMAVAGRDCASIKTSDLGFIVGPRLNAAGRLDDMSLGIRCLLTDDYAEALALAQELDGLNRERRAIEASMQKEANDTLVQMFGRLQGELPPALCLYEASWHQGVIGILASRVKDQYHCPVIVFAEDGEDTLKGSGRSVAGIHLRDALDQVATQNPGLLNKFGGHAMAAGLSLDKHQLSRFQQAFTEVVAQLVGPQGLQAKIETDGSLNAQDFNLQLAAEIEAQGPWGQAFPEPEFDGVFQLVQQKIVGQKHLKMVLASADDPQTIVDAIAFNVDLELWPNSDCQWVRAVYKLNVNEFRGQRSCQLLVDYMEPVSSSE